jgi:protein-S-isoprenylcysteine O-methyltransferase Ste14
MVVVKYIGALIITGLIIFLPAGGFHFINGWLFIISFFVPMIFTIIYFLYKDPELIEKRMHTNEKQGEQKVYVLISLVLFIIAFAIPGLDFRYGWSSVPTWLSVAAFCMVELGYVMFIIVMKQNSYASRVIELQEGQKVITTGLYSFVRHPMYSAAIIIYLASPVLLGSYWALIPIAAFPFLLAFRAVNEENVLSKELPGYSEYMERVRYRLIPHIW